ncbi:hypothetical protein BMS3Abin06_02067 [bacterium BMS3Abin06]|nr:hypothetical protein BMS3Abin06_02067 [bacterium BMS3Abin06]
MRSVLEIRAIKFNKNAARCRNPQAKEIVMERRWRIKAYKFAEPFLLHQIEGTIPL